MFCSWGRLSKFFVRGKETVFSNPNYRGGLYEVLTKSLHDEQSLPSDKVLFTISMSATYGPCWRIVGVQSDKGSWLKFRMTPAGVHFRGIPNYADSEMVSFREFSVRIDGDEFEETYSKLLYFVEGSSESSGYVVPFLRYTQYEVVTREGELLAAWAAYPTWYYPHGVNPEAILKQHNASFRLLGPISVALVDSSNVGRDDASNQGLIDLATAKDVNEILKFDDPSSFKDKIVSTQRKIDRLYVIAENSGGKFMIGKENADDLSLDYWNSIASRLALEARVFIYSDVDIASKETNALLQKIANVFDRDIFVLNHRHPSKGFDQVFLPMEL